MDHSPWGRALIILAVIAVGLYVAGQLWDLAVHFGDIIILFFLAWLLAFVLLPVVRFLETKLPLGRVGAAAVVYLVLLVCLVALVVLVVPLLVEQVAQLTDQLPAITDRVPGWLRTVQTALDRHGIPVEIATAGTGSALGQQATQFGAQLLENTVVIASGIASGLFRFSLILILSFYFVVDGDRFVGDVLAAIPDQYAADARSFLASIDKSFGGFLRGTGIQAVFFGVGTAAVMGFAGLHYILLASFFAAVVMIVPFVGPLLAMVLPLLIAVFSNLSTSQLLVLFLALGALQLLVLNVIAPKVMSDSVGLHPLLVFLALLVGIKQAGLAGAIFGVPVAAVIYASALILLRRWKVIEQNERPVSPLVVAGAADPPEVPTAHPYAAVRIEQFSLHVGRAISRLFHERSS